MTGPEQKLPDLTAAAEAICHAGRILDSKDMAPATSGNYSMRLGDGTLAITKSGCHKGRLTPDDILRIDAGGRPLENKKPSAETLLHTQLYGLFPQANAILHVHSLAGVVLTRVLKKDVELEGYEMQKVFPGVETHAKRITIPVVENSQNMVELSEEVAKRVEGGVAAYIIRGHGFYVWAREMEHCINMCEGLDHLLACELETLKIRAGAFS